MGQAKQRGTFEERRAQAMKNKPVISIPHRARSTPWLSALMAAISSTAMQWRK